MMNTPNNNNNSYSQKNNTLNTNESIMYQNTQNNSVSLSNTTTAVGGTPLLACLNSPRSASIPSISSFPCYTADHAIAWMNFIKGLSNLSRILSNSNFERSPFSNSNCILEKMSFILLKNAVMKVHAFSELFSTQYTEWAAKGNSGRFAEI